MRTSTLRRLVKTALLLAGLAGAPVDAAAQAVLQVWDGESGVGAQFDYFGSSVAMLGDINGDGISDGLVGAPEGDDQNVQVGEAWVKSGLDGSVIYKFAGSVQDGLFGLDVGAPGDLDGDGIADFLVSSPDLVAPRGHVYAYSGATGASLYVFEGKRSGDEFGGSIDMVGDVDGDGCADFVVGAEDFDYHLTLSQSGRAYVYSGKSGTQLYTIDGTASYEFLGSSVCGIGDLDGDGRPEIGIGASGWGAGSSGQGTFSIYSGATGSLLVYLEGEVYNDLFGAQCCRLGDVDRDGFDEFAVKSAHGNNFVSEGRVYVYSGATASLLYTFDGGAYNEELGILPHDGRLDVNHDGYADIAIGDPLHDGGGGPAGAVYVYSGRTGRLMYAWYGGFVKYTWDTLGSALSVAGDINGDGIDDLIVGAPTNSSVQNGAGRVYIFAGNDLLLQSNQTSYVAGDTLTLDIRGGEPYVLDALVVTAVNGLPLFVPLALGTLDQFGEWELTGTVPTGLAGLSLTFTAYAQKSVQGGIVDSSPQTVTFN
jgi:FG-GAP repeat protein